MQTVRQQMIEALTERKHTARSLSQTLCISEKEVFRNLPHVARSAASRDGKFLVSPARCVDCGFVFKDRKRFTKPSRCPRCRSEQIQQPEFQII